MDRLEVKVPRFPHEDEGIPVRFLEKAEIVGNEEGGYLWVVPSTRLHCPKCHYEPHEVDVNRFTVGSECPGHGYKSFMSADEASQKSLMDLKKYECKYMGIIERLWVCADIWNITFQKMVDETVAAKEDGNPIQKMLWRKWHTKEGTIARMPIQIRDNVNKDHKFWLRKTKRNTEETKV